MRYVWLFLALIACNTENQSETEAVKIPQTPEHTDYLLYISDRGEGFDIYQFSPAEGESKVTSNPGWDWHPQPLDDGTFVYYSIDSSEAFTIRRASLDGTDSIFYTYGKDDISIAPDGTSLIYYNRFEESRYMGILSMNAAVDSVAITPRGVYSGRAKWSPDGTKVAYISDRTGTNQLFMYDVIQDKSMQLTDSAGTKKYISWSPDNLQIAFTIQFDNGPSDIYVFGLEYGTTDRLTNTPDINEAEIAWSPDGERIAYHAEIDSSDHIYTVTIGSGDIKRITQFAGYHGEPAWIRVYSPPEM